MLHRAPRAGQVSEVPNPASIALDRAFYMKRNPEGVPVQTSALVVWFDVRQSMSSFERELFEDLHHGIPRNLWV